MTDWSERLDAMLARINAEIAVRCAVEAAKLRGPKFYRRSVGQRYGKRGKK